MIEGNIRWWAESTRTIGSEFYATLLGLMADDADAGGPAERLLHPYAGRSWGDAYVLRLMGGVHRLVLTGAAPALARHYPSTGGDGDAGAAWPAGPGLLEGPPTELGDALSPPPQT